MRRQLVSADLARSTHRVGRLGGDLQRENIILTSYNIEAAYRRAQSAPPMRPENLHPLFCDPIPSRASAPFPPNHGASSATWRPTEAERAAEKQKKKEAVKEARRQARVLQARVEKAAVRKVLKQAQREAEKRREEEVRQRQEDERRLLEMQQLNAIQVKALLDEQMHKVEERYQAQQRKKEKREERDKKREERDRLEREKREERDRLEREERDRLKLQEVQRSLQRAEAARRAEEKRRRALEQQVARLQAEREAEEDAVKIETSRTQFELRQQENDLRVRQDAQNRAREVIRDDAVVRNAAEAAAKAEQEKQAKRARKEVGRAARAAVVAQAAEKEAIVVRDSSPAPEEPQDEIKKQEHEDAPNQHVNACEDPYISKKQLHGARRLHIRFDADGGAAPVSSTARMPIAAATAPGPAPTPKRRLSQDTSEASKKHRQCSNLPPTARPETGSRIREYRVSGPPPTSVTPAEVAQQARMRIAFSTPYRARPSGPTFVPQGSHVRFLDESQNRHSLASEGGSSPRLPRNPTPHPSSQPAITYVAPPARGRIHRAPRPPIFEFNLEAAREAARADPRPPLRSSQLRQVPTEFYTSPAPESWLPGLAGISRLNTPMISSPLVSRGRTLNLIQRRQLRPTAREVPPPTQPSTAPHDDPSSSSDSDSAGDDDVSDREQSLEIPDSQDDIEASMSPAPPPPIDDSDSDSSDVPDDKNDDDWEFGADDVSDDEEVERAISRSTSCSSTVPLCSQPRPRRTAATQPFRSSPPPEMSTRFEDDADSEDAMEISDDDTEAAPVTPARAVLVVVPPRTGQIDRSQYVRFTPPELIALRQAQRESESLPPTTRPRRTTQAHLAAYPQPTSRAQRAGRGRQVPVTADFVIGSTANLPQRDESSNESSDDSSDESSDEEVAPAAKLSQHQAPQFSTRPRAPGHRRRLNLGDVIRELTPAEMIARELRRRRVKTPRPEDWTQRETGMTDSEEGEWTFEEVFTEYEESDSSDSGSESLPPIDRLEPDMEKAREEARRREDAQEVSVAMEDENAEERGGAPDDDELDPDQQDSEEEQEEEVGQEQTPSERQLSVNRAPYEGEVMQEEEEEEAPIAKPDPEDHERDEYDRWRRARSHHPTYHAVPFRPGPGADVDVAEESGEPEVRCESGHASRVLTKEQSVQAAEELASAKREPADEDERELFEQWRRERSRIPYHLTPFKDPRTRPKNMEPEMDEDEDASPLAALDNANSMVRRDETGDTRSVESRMAPSRPPVC